VKKTLRLFAILLVLLAVSAAPSPAILEVCSEWCSCEVSCDWACWDYADNTPKSCGDYGSCSGLCGVTP
jgi:hypothetical protein